MAGHDEQAIEKEIQAKGLTAPRLTPSDIDAIMARSKLHFWIVPGTTMTLCAAVLPNGFVITGESAAASKENFDEKIGRDIAMQNARNKVWQLEGYLLRQKLHDEERPF